MSASFLPVCAAPTSLVHANGKLRKFSPNQWEIRRKLSAPFLPVSAAPISAVVHENRQLADFSPSQWGDIFLTINPDLTTILDSERHQIQELKGEVKTMITATEREPLEKLHLIDQIQRLGLAYHFEKEIDEYLEEVKKLYFEHEGSGISFDHLDLYTTALLFRLLRQQGYRISPDIFQRFKDRSTGSFMDSLTGDTRGLISLYEASHLRIHGEDILEEAFAFSLDRLQRFLKNYNENNNQNDGSSVLLPTEVPSLAAQVGHALEQCIWKGLAWTEARFYISVYEEENCHNESLLTLAKLDFNFLQKQHLQEIHEISRWWKEKDIIRRLPFGRDRLVEGYYWALATYFEPQYTLAREIFAKVFLFFSALDDIYDAYGTFEELQLLTNAIERWDISTMNQLPECIQVFYKGLLDLFDEIEQKLVDVGGQSYRMYYAKEVMKLQASAYFEEYKWLNEKKIPTVEEYLSVAQLTIGNIFLMIISLLGMGDLTTEHAFKWSISSQNDAMRASEVICRLTNDIITNKFEQQRAHVASVVECFMKEHGVTEEMAVKELWKKVDYAWKDLNSQCLQPIPVSDPVSDLLLTRVLNLTRCLSLFYNDKIDYYTHSNLKFKQKVVALLIDPIPI
ncbi:hypothetical protein SAY87_023157 [Trapa incisa]|uniref:Uncharacterized protein n=1 Tax=Trapa incisa TaxID=236973 RepID=A0AAN7K8Q5_9MYRT|nr:hypothetical protein SAY87_023157 [Trapa incisa]